jgi:hypothetical protein
VGIKESLVKKNKWDEPWHFFSAEAELSRLSAEKDEEDSEKASEEETDQPLTSVLLPSLEDQTPPDPDATQVAAPLPGDAESNVLRDLTEEQSIEIRLSLLSALQADHEDKDEVPNSAKSNEGQATIETSH